MKWMTRRRKIRDNPKLERKITIGADYDARPLSLASIARFVSENAFRTSRLI